MDVCGQEHAKSYNIKLRGAQQPLSLPYSNACVARGGWKRRFLVVYWRWSGGAGGELSGGGNIHRLQQKYKNGILNAVGQV